MRLRIALAAALVALGGPAWAHRGHASLSVVEIDAASGAVTVTHRMAAHDVEPALSGVAPNAQPSVDDEDALHAFEAYAGRAFRLWDSDGKAVVLTHRRTNLAGDDVELVFGGQLAPPANAVSVDSDLLEGTFADQENQVNVRRNRITRTVVFRPGDGAQSVGFE